MRNYEKWLIETMKKQGEDNILFKEEKKPFFCKQKASLSSSASGRISGEGQLYTLTLNNATQVAEQIYVEKNSFSESRYLKKDDGNYLYGKQINLGVKDDSFKEKFKIMVPLYDCNDKAKKMIRGANDKKFDQTMPNIKPFDEKKASEWNPDDHHVSENLAMLLEQNVRCRGLGIPYKPFLNKKAVKECVRYFEENPEKCLRIWDEAYEKVSTENNKRAKEKNLGISSSLKQAFQKITGKTEEGKKTRTRSA